MVVYHVTERAIRFPKTYPTLATPIFTVQRPIRGIAHDVEAALSKAIHSEAQKLRGSEMVFQVRLTRHMLMFNAFRSLYYRSLRQLRNG